MARRISLTVRISAIVSIFVAALIGIIILVIALRLGAAVNELVYADNEQIAMARSLQLGELMDKLYWQLRMIAVRNQIRTGDKKTIEATVLALNGQFSPEVVGAFYAWKDGEYFSTEGGRGNISDRDYYEAIITKGADRAVGEAVISKILGVPIVVSAAAVKGEDNKAQGFVAFQFKLEKLSEIASAIKVGRTGYGWIIDNTGLVIAYPQADAIMKFNFTNADKDGYKGLDALGKKLLKEEYGLGSYRKPDGTAMANFYARVPNSPGWSLGLSVNEVEINATVRGLVSLLIAILVVGVVLAVIVAFFIARSIVKPVQLVMKAMECIAEGDLILASVDTGARERLYVRGDELGALGRSMRDLRGSLTDVAGEITTAATQVSEGSEQLSQTAQGISQGASEQAASIEELSASVEELASTVRQNADNTSQADALARRVAQNADESGKAVGKMVDSMTQIAGRISIIEEIARQTNLLALNAAIEAARAGEAGKGFAVVASEVRKLAERSQKAAGEINELSKSSVEVAGDAGKKLNELLPDIKRTAELIQEIAAASSEQASGADQIAKGVSQMDTVVQQNASASEELASTAEELEGQARHLGETIGFFKLGDGSGLVAGHGAVSRGIRQGTSRGIAVKSGPAGRKTLGAPREKEEEVEKPKAEKPATSITLAKGSDAKDSDFEEF
jgi:methyl-accepting chemotaxis protein